MSLEANLKDIGWMCHWVPLKIKNKPIDMPPISQIPNIGLMPNEDEINSEKIMYFKPTDTPYIRLAKMGGRKNLLCIEKMEGPNKPVPYSRCEWYYLEDNNMESEENVLPTTKHIFKVPFYMTHPAPK